MSTVWKSFKQGFLELWTNEEVHKGQSYLRGIYPDAAGLKEAQTQYMQRLWQVTTLPISVAGNRSTHRSISAVSG